MKQVFLFFTLFSFITGWATDPTTSASNVSFSLIDGGQFNLSFTAGSGNGRIVVVKEGSAVTGVPVDGVTYGSTNTSSSDARFGVSGTEFTAAGEYVVYRGITSANIAITKLKPGTTYYVAIFEYNTGGAPNPDYSIVTPAEKNVTTVIAPTVRAAISGFSNITGNAVRINYNNGNGSGRIIVVRKGNTFTATPSDLVSYNYSASFKSTVASSYYLDPESFVVLKWNNSIVGKADFADVTNLEPNTTYTFAIFEYNSSTNALTPVYLQSPTIQTVTTNSGPTKAASGFTFSTIDGTRLGFYWSMGNGARRIVVAKKATAVVNTPTNGKRYTANAQFGLGEELVASSGEFVVYDGTSNSVTVTGLEKFTTYHFAVYEFDVDGNGFAYYQTLAPGATNRSTALPPTANTTLQVSNITGSSAQLTYKYPASGYGESRMLVIRDGAPVDFLPDDLVVYGGFTSNYGSGQLIAPNTYTLYGQGNGGAPNVTGLLPGHTYYVTVFDMNGSNTPVYLKPGSSAVISIPNEPANPSTNFRFTTTEGNSMRVDWNVGTGSRRIVVVRKGAAVTSTPQDGNTYTAADKFGLGAELTASLGEYVVYDGTGSSVTVSGLEKGTTYHFAVFEYNTGGSGPDYLTTPGKWLATSGATLSAPTLQVTNLNAYNIQATQASVSFTIGNGSTRLFVMREGGPVDVEPEDFKSYPSSPAFGTAGYQIGTGNYVVSSGSAAFTVTNLKAGTQYYITAFEYNGSSSPVYLRPGATSYNFTTTGGVAAPTTISHTPLFENIDGNKFTFKWTNGNGANRIVVARKGSPVSFTPANGTEYTFNAAFGSGSDLGSGQYVIYKGTGSSVDLTQLEPSTTYHFAVYEYNGATTNTKYLTSASLMASQASATAPTNAATVIGATFTTSTITFNWNKGNGNGRLVLLKEGSEVTAAPTNLIAYSANTDFKNAPQLAAGEFIVYAGSGNSVTVSGITTGKTYHFAVFEYNGSSAPVYNTATYLQAAIATTPLPVTWIAFAGTMIKEGVRLEWTTAQEVNNSGFEVESSSDGVAFSKIGSVMPNSTFVYQYLDRQPLAGIAYYRIKQLDSDGQASYSKTIKVQGGVTAAVIRLLQNPVQGQLKLQSSQQLLGGQLQVINAEGKVLRTQSVSDQLQFIDVQVLQKGVYYLQVFSKEGKREAVLPFIKN